MKMDLRQSMINMYLKCPQQFKYRYIDNKVIPSSSMAKQGTSFHKGLDHNYKLKIETKTDLPVEEVCQVVSDTFDKEFQVGDIMWNEEQKSEGIDKVRGELKDEVIDLTKLYQKEMAPKIQPLASEKSFELEFENVDYKLTGTIDLIDDKNVVHDHKTTGRKPSSLNESYLIQGILYCLGAGAKSAVFDYVVKPGKRKPSEIVSIGLDVNDDMARYALNMVGMVKNGIEKEIFYPNRANTLCSKKYCGYWSQCQYDFGGVIRD